MLESRDHSGISSYSLIVIDNAVTRFAVSAWTKFPDEPLDASVLDELREPLVVLAIQAYQAGYRDGLMVCLDEQDREHPAPSRLRNFIREEVLAAVQNVTRAVRSERSILLLSRTMKKLLQDCAHLEDVMHNQGLFDGRMEWAKRGYPQEEDTQPAIGIPPSVMPPTDWRLPV